MSYCKQLYANDEIGVKSLTTLYPNPFYIAVQYIFYSAYVKIFDSKKFYYVYLLKNILMRVLFI